MTFIHEPAEHKGGEFSDSVDQGAGYEFSGELSKTESQPVREQVCASDGGSLQVGDTIETHYVYTTAQVEPAPSLASCFNEATANPQLRVEAQTYVLVNDDSAQDFKELAEVEKQGEYYQAANLPEETGETVEYSGSTTGPAFNDEPSPLKVTWNVRPEVAKVNIDSVDEWCEDNVFEENHAQGARNLVTETELLSQLSEEEQISLSLIWCRSSPELY